MALAPATRPVKCDWVSPCKKPSSFSPPCTFKFLNVVHDLKSLSDWNNPEWEKLWLYNLHYFDDLGSCDAESKKKLHFDLIEKWIQENPPGHGNGWEPYPISLRIVNWIKWSLNDNCLSDNALHSLAIQTRYLLKKLEFHLLGNHLFANAKALVFAGLFFKGKQADEWFAKGMKILTREIFEQILPDGGHFERSPMYHSIILEDMLDLINGMRAFGREVPGGWMAAASKMSGWLAAMCHPDGEIALFNDAAFGIAAKPADLMSYARRVGTGERETSAGKFTYLSDSGYVRWEKGAAALFLDVGQVGPDYLPGHAHADTLSFEMSLHGLRFIVDSGTSCYGTGGERLRQRGTEAHNTVMINGKNSSEVWSGFRMARRARPADLNIMPLSGQAETISCAHTGYMRLPGKPAHKRCWSLTETSLEIIDEIQGGFQNAVSLMHFHPDVEITSFTSSKNKIRLRLPNDQSITVIIEGGHCRIMDSTWHPEFGVSLANQCLEVEFIRERVVLSIKF